MRNGRVGSHFYSQHVYSQYACSQHVHSQHARARFLVRFASTYSYPAAMRIPPLAATAGVTVRFRPFLLGPIFQAQGWDTSPFNLYPAKGRYMWRDLERLCADLGLRFRQPETFPQPSLLAARVALVGLAENWGEDFCRAGSGRVRRSRPDRRYRHHRAAAHAIRVDPEDVLAKAQSEPIKTQLRDETQAAQQLGIFGAPSFVTAVASCSGQRPVGAGARLGDPRWLGHATPETNLSPSS